MKRLLWAGAAVLVAAVVAIPAWIAFSGDDDGPRRAGALAAGAAAVGPDVGRLTVSNVNGGLPFTIRSYGWGVSSPRDVASGQASGQARYNELSVTRPIDALTPPFFNMVVQNTTAPTAKLELLSAPEGGKPGVYMTYNLTNARVSSWRNAASETLGLRYETISVKTGVAGFPAPPAAEVVGQITLPAAQPVPIVGIVSEVLSPTDPATGLATGKRQHKPFVVRRAIDGRSESLLNTATSNGILNQVKIELVQGGSSVPYATYTLQNASIASYQHSGAGGSAAIEEVAFTFQSIELKHGAAVATDSWAAAAVS